MLEKWGSPVYLRPAWRRAYTEMLKILEYVDEKEKEKIVPKEDFEFLKKYHDPDYHFAEELSEDDEDFLDELLNAMSWEGDRILEMYDRYFMRTEEEREKYDRNIIDHARQKMIRPKKYIDEGIARFLERHRQDGRPFEGMEPALLKKNPVGCAQVLTILDNLAPQYKKKIPREYLWILGAGAKKGYRYRFVTEWEDERLKVQEELSEEAWEILADIEVKFWKGYQVREEEIEVDLQVIPR